MTDSGQIAGFQNLNLRSVYFDTSSWNGLVKSPIREKLIERVQKTKQPVLVSVISAGEVLRIRDPALRERTCRAMLALHGDGPLLDHPLNLARASALAVLHAERDFLLPESGPAKQLRDCLSNLTSPPAREIQEWLENLDCNMQRFLQEIKPPERDLVTEYVSLEVLSREDFLKLLCQFPPARELRLSVPQMRDICMGATFGKALGATLAYIIRLSSTHSPKSKRSRRRPGGPDMWQIPYLGVVETFVTGDKWMAEAAARVSTVFPHPRRVLLTQDFLSEFESR